MSDWEHIWNRLHSEGWSLGHVQNMTPEGLRWLVDATDHRQDPPLFYRAQGVTLREALERLGAAIRAPLN
jgi:hypothetical protein